MELKEEDYFPKEPMDIKDKIDKSKIFKTNIIIGKKIRMRIKKQRKQRNLNKIIFNQKCNDIGWDYFTKINGCTIFKTKINIKQCNINARNASSAPPISPQNGCIVTSLENNIKINTKNGKYVK